MIQMPEALREAWSPLWATGHVRERPWWVFDGYHGTNPYTNQFQSGVYYKRRDKHILWVSGESVDAALATYDAESPMPPPSPSQGQVWLQVEGAGRFLDVGDVFSIVSILRQQPVAAVQGSDEPRLAVLKTWPPPGAVLVAGPTPWGRDCPWAPAIDALRLTRSWP